MTMDSFSDDPVATLQRRIAGLEAALQAAVDRSARGNERLADLLDGTRGCQWEGDLETGTLVLHAVEDGRMVERTSTMTAWLAALHPDDRDSVVARYHAHLDGATPQYEAEYRLLSPNRTVSWIWDHGRVTARDARGRPLRVSGMRLDITRWKKANEELLWLAHYDPLTGLPNRRTFYRQLKGALSSMQQDRPDGLAVLFLDLDNFKQVNDRYGHAVGDQVLVQVSHRLRHQLRNQDVVARHGGDEFVLLLVGDNIRAVVNDVAMRILRAIASPLSVNAIDIDIGTSIGVSLYPQHGTSPESLMQHADGAMYAAKAAGRHRICFDPA